MFLGHWGVAVSGTSDSDSADLSRTSFFVHLLIIVKVIIVVPMIYSNW